MEKELFIAVCDRLKEAVPELRWIDADEGQLNVSERPPVAFPCCLVEMSYPQCENHTAGTQRVRVQFALRVAFNCCAATNAAAPVAVREPSPATARYVAANSRSIAVVELRASDQSRARVRVTPERRSDGLKVYTAVYESAFMD